MISSSQLRFHYAQITKNPPQDVKTNDNARKETPGSEEVIAYYRYANCGSYTGSQSLKESISSYYPSIVRVGHESSRGYHP